MSEYESVRTGMCHRKVSAKESMKFQNVIMSESKCSIRTLAMLVKANLSIAVSQGKIWIFESNCNTQAANKQASSMQADSFLHENVILVKKSIKDIIL